MNSSEYSIKKFISWFFLIITLLGSAVSWFLDLSPYFPNSDWRFLAIIFTLLFAFNAIFRINKLERLISDKTPNVIIHKKPHIEELSLRNELLWLVSQNSEEISSGDIHQVARISFANVPKNNTEQNHARRVSAKLIYKDTHGKIILGPIYARWTNSDIPRKRSDYKKDKFIFQHLDSAGLSRSIDLAYKMVSSDRCYAFSNINYIEDINYSPFWIKEKSFYIEIILTGERLNKRFTCEVYNDGKGKPLRVAIHQTWLEKLYKKITGKE